MNTETQIVPAKWDIEAPAANYRMAENVADACREIVVSSAIAIGNRNYLPVEAWNCIALTHGCVSSACDVREVSRDGKIIGYRATGQVRLMVNGQVIAEAEGFVGEDEKTWRGRNEYAKRAMAQTRSISRACRSAFAHIILLMNAKHGTNLSTCPKEEVPDEGFVEPRETDSYTAARDGGYTSTRGGEREEHREQPARDADGNAGPRGWRDVKIHFGKNKGVRLGDLEPQQLSWYQKEWQPRPFRGRISDDDLGLRAALDASMGAAPTLSGIVTPAITNSIERSDLCLQFESFIKAEVPTDQTPEVFARNFAIEAGKLLGKGDELTSFDSLTDDELRKAWDMRTQVLVLFDNIPF